MGEKVTERRGVIILYGEMEVGLEMKFAIVGL